MSSFSPWRQRLSRLLDRLGIGGVFRRSYDLLVFPVVQNRTKSSLERGLRARSDLNVGGYLQIVESLKPKAFDGTLVRVGSKGDGGYLLPQDCFGVEALFSPGVAGSSSLELAFARQNIRCFLADASVSGPTTTHENFNFEPVFIGKNSSPGWLSLEDWVTSKGCAESQELALQMDIEGSEWEVFETTSSELLAKFRWILVEFHNFQDLALLETQQTRGSVLGKISQTHFPAHIHLNNFGKNLEIENLVLPQAVEITYLRRSDYQELGFAEIPSKLDLPNNPNLSDLEIPSYWHSR